MTISRDKPAFGADPIIMALSYIAGAGTDFRQTRWNFGRHSLEGWHQGKWWIIEPFDFFGALDVSYPRL